MIVGRIIVVTVEQLWVWKMNKREVLMVNNMNNGEKIINCLMNQADYLYMNNIEPSRIILGVHISNILKAYKDMFMYYKNPKPHIKCMGLPVTIDCENKWILMVCGGNECNGEYWLDEEKF